MGNNREDVYSTVGRSKCIIDPLSSGGLIGEHMVSQVKKDAGFRPVQK